MLSVVYLVCFACMFNILYPYTSYYASDIVIHVWLYAWTLGKHVEFYAEFFIAKGYNLSCMMI